MAMPRQHLTFDFSKELCLKKLAAILRDYDLVFLQNLEGYFLKRHQEHYQQGLRLSPPEEHCRQKTE